MGSPGAPASAGRGGGGEAGQPTHAPVSAPGQGGLPQAGAAVRAIATQSRPRLAETRLPSRAAPLALLWSQLRRWGAASLPVAHPGGCLGPAPPNLHPDVLLLLALRLPRLLQPRHVPAWQEARARLIGDPCVRPGHSHQAARPDHASAHSSPCLCLPEAPLAQPLGAAQRGDEALPPPSPSLPPQLLFYQHLPPAWAARGPLPHPPGTGSGPQNP